MNNPRTWRAILVPMKQAWDRRSPREQQLMAWAAVLILLVGVWRLALAPALRTWQEAPERQARLDRQTHSMRQLQAQAIALQKPRPIPRNEAAQWLEKNLTELGPNAKINLRRSSGPLAEAGARKRTGPASASPAATTHPFRPARQHRIGQKQNKPRPSHSGPAPCGT